MHAEDDRFVGTATATFRATHSSATPWLAGWLAAWRGWRVPSDRRATVERLMDHPQQKKRREAKRSVGSYESVGVKARRGQ
jgi:hypothetical protein